MHNKRPFRSHFPTLITLYISNFTLIVIFLLFITFFFSSHFIFVSFFTVTKYIRTGIADKDDYPLFFEKAFYETEVDENEEINHSLLTVTARTHNECKYCFVKNNKNKRTQNKYTKMLRLLKYKLWA